jgi:chitinase
MMTYRLRSGATATTGAVAVSYFRRAQTLPVIQNAPPLPGGENPNDPGLAFIFGRIMQCLGGDMNPATFVALVTSIHGPKTLVSGYVHLHFTSEK